MKKIINACLVFNLGFISLHASYPQYQTHAHQKVQGDGMYKTFIKKIKQDTVKTIFEIGSRDARDAIELSDLFKCHVFAFECNPIAIEICKKNIGSNPNVTLVPFGVWNEPGEKIFYSITTGNIGASSFFPFDPNARNAKDVIEEGLIQEKIIVQTVRLDEFLRSREIENIDLLCMDVQGAAFEVLCSLGEQLRKVKYIIVELERHSMYLGEVLYHDVDHFLTSFGFVRSSPEIPKGSMFGDMLYINGNIK